MADDKRKKDERDRSRVAADEGYEIEYLAETTGITRTQAIALIQEHGNDRSTLLREARKLGEMMQPEVIQFVLAVKRIIRRELAAGSQKMGRPLRPDLHRAKLGPYTRRHGDAVGNPQIRSERQLLCKWGLGPD